MQTLETLIHEFTRSHLTRYHTPGKDEYHKQISLLEQLENLKTERRNTSGGTRGYPSDRHSQGVRTGRQPSPEALRPDPSAHSGYPDG